MNFIKNRVEAVRLMLRFIRNKSRLKHPISIIGQECVSVGKGVYIKANARIECYKEYSPKVIIGDNVIIMYSFTCLAADTVSIGDNTILASNVSIIAENHGQDPTIGCYYTQPLQHDMVKIGSGCWIGQNVTILPGVELGDNVIVGANSLVNKSFGSNVIIGGIPARVIKIYDFEKKEWKKV